MALGMAPFIKVVEHVFVTVYVGIAAKEVKVIRSVDVTFHSLNRTVVELGKLTGLQEFRKICGFLEIELTAIIDTRTTVIVATLGLHKDYAIGCSGTIDSGCGSILKD